MFSLCIIISTTANVNSSNEEKFKVTKLLLSLSISYNQSVCVSLILSFKHFTIPSCWIYWKCNAEKKSILKSILPIRQEACLFLSFPQSIQWCFYCNWIRLHWIKWLFYSTLVLLFWIKPLIWLSDEQFFERHKTRWRCDAIQCPKKCFKS